MIIKIFNKIFPRRGNNRRAISPVIATILLIALTVSAAAIVYFVVVPLLQGEGELVQTDSLELKDLDDDGYFDEITITLFNLGTDTITLDEEVTIQVYAGSNPSYTWVIDTSLEYAIQTERDTTIIAQDNSSQIAPLTTFEITISYGKDSLTTGRQLTPYAEAGGGSDDTPTVNYTGMSLYLRTAQDDPTTSRSSFPTTSGYSPLLWFIVGIFNSGTSGVTDQTDYISTNGFGAAEEYRPYIGISDSFSTDISSHTNYQVLAYNDSGNYPGCVTFRGSSFDGGDTFNWPQRGIAYMYTYIYNPTDDPMDVSLSIQTDDAYWLWVNDQYLNYGTYTNNGWRTWRTPESITLNPGYNVITIKSADNGGNWDSQILLWDAGDTDDLTSLLNVWPLITPTSDYW